MIAQTSAPCLSVTVGLAISYNVIFLVDMASRRKRDQDAATRFSRQAIRCWCRPTKLTLDAYQPNHVAIQEL